MDDFTRGPRESPGKAVGIADGSGIVDAVTDVRRWTGPVPYTNHDLISRIIMTIYFAHL